LIDACSFESFIIFFEFSLDEKKSNDIDRKCFFFSTSSSAEQRLAGSSGMRISASSGNINGKSNKTKEKLSL